MKNRSLGYKANWIYLVFLVSCSSLSNLYESNNANKPLENPSYPKERLMFYNVENLYDCQDDSLKNDNEFLPDGPKKWNEYRFYHKINNIAKVIVGIGEWELPAIVGLCEIENDFVLRSLTKSRPLKNAGYKYIHKDSPDQRGMDVALLYHPDKFKPLNYQVIELKNPEKPYFKSRDILYVKGILFKKDTFHIYINHWPSRRGGQLASEVNRLLAASLLKNSVDSIFHLNSKAKIIILGDFNDYPDNKSITTILNAEGDLSNLKRESLYDLAYHLQFKHGLGSYKFRGRWGMLDHLIVSGNVMKFNLSENNVRVYYPGFLLENDNGYLGYKPYRTYFGPQYHSGISDHLPVYLDLEDRKQDE